VPSRLASLWIALPTSNDRAWSTWRRGGELEHLAERAARVVGMKAAERVVMHHDYLDGVVTACYG